MITPIATENYNNWWKSVWNGLKQPGESKRVNIFGFKTVNVFPNYGKMFWV